MPKQIDCWNVENLSDDPRWNAFRRLGTTRAIRMSGEFTVECLGRKRVWMSDGYIVEDENGLRAVTKEDFEATYTRIPTETNI